MEATASSALKSALDLQKVIFAVGSLPRWRILVELAKGEALPASEIARRVRLSANAGSKHLVLMHSIGLLRRGYGNLYSIFPEFITGPNRLDFGPITLRLDYPDPTRKGRAATKSAGEGQPRKPSTGRSGSSCP